jgi:hypothetical protein
MNIRQVLRVAAGTLLIGVAGSFVAVHFFWKSFGPDFESPGIQVGQPAPNLMVTTEDGVERPLLKLRGNGLLLVVSASLTCPISRREAPKAELIARKFRDRVSVVVLYTLEAHPIAGTAFYNEGHDQPRANREAGIARVQPSTLEERDQLADEFKEHVGLSLPVVLDDMENQAWKSFGGGSNMALLIGKDGIVMAKQGWFDYDEMHESIEKALSL